MNTNSDWGLEFQLNLIACDFTVNLWRTGIVVKLSRVGTINSYMTVHRLECPHNNVLYLQNDRQVSGTGWSRICGPHSPLIPIITYSTKSTLHLPPTNYLSLIRDEAFRFILEIPTNMLSTVFLSVWNYFMITASTYVHRALLYYTTASRLSRTSSLRWIIF